MKPAIISPSFLITFPLRPQFITPLFSSIFLIGWQYALSPRFCYRAPTERNAIGFSSCLRSIPGLSSMIAAPAEPLQFRWSHTRLHRLSFQSWLHLPFAVSSSQSIGPSARPETAEESVVPDRCAARQSRVCKRVCGKRTNNPFLEESISWANDARSILRPRDGGCFDTSGWDSFPKQFDHLLVVNLPGFEQERQTICKRDSTFSGCGFLSFELRSIETVGAT